MEIAVFSDTHDNIPNTEKAIEHCVRRKISRIIHCGDVSNEKTLEMIGENFSGDVYLSLGNADINVDAIKKAGNAFKMKIFSSFGMMETPKGTIGFCHFPWIAKEEAKKNKYEIIFYGHTHTPWEESVNNTKLINPGTLAGMFQKATFAIWNTDTDTAELVLLETL